MPGPPPPALAAPRRRPRRCRPGGRDRRPAWDPAAGLAAVSAISCSSRCAGAPGRRAAPAPAASRRRRQQPLPLPGPGIQRRPGPTGRPGSGGRSPPPARRPCIARRGSLRRSRSSSPICRAWRVFSAGSSSRNSCFSATATTRRPVRAGLGQPPQAGRRPAGSGGPAPPPSVPGWPSPRCGSRAPPRRCAPAPGPAPPPPRCRRRGGCAARGWPPARASRRLCWCRCSDSACQGLAVAGGGAQQVLPGPLGAGGVTESLAGAAGPAGAAPPRLRGRILAQLRDLGLQHAGQLLGAPELLVGRGQGIEGGGVARSQLEDLLPPPGPPGVAQPVLQQVGDSQRHPQLLVVGGDVAQVVLQRLDQPLAGPRSARGCSPAARAPRGPRAPA